MLLDWNAKSPHLEYEPTEYCFRSAAVRRLPDDKVYIRVNNFVMPWSGVICAPDPDRPSTAFMSFPAARRRNRNRPAAQHMAPGCPATISARFSTRE